MTRMDLGSDDVKVLIEGALDNPEIPKLYANGFVSALGNSDVLVVLLQNQRPIASLNLSYTAAKTLSGRLIQLIKSLERVTGNTIMTVDDVASALEQKDSPEEDENGSSA